MEPGTVVPVGGVLARLRTEATEPPKAPSPAPTALPPTRSRRPSGCASRRSRGAWRGISRSISTGCTGRDRTGRSAWSTSSAPPTGPPASAPAGVARAIARLMSRAQREVPQYHVATDIDLSAATAWLADRNAARSLADRLLPAALLLAAASRAARQVPELNGFWETDGFRPSASGAPGRGDLTARRRPRRPGHPRRGPAGSGRADARPARPRASRSHRRAAGVGDGGSDDHGDEPRRPGRSHGVRRALPPAGGARRVRHRRRAPLGGPGHARRPSRRHRDASADHRATDGATGARFLRAVDRLLQAPEELA